MKSEKNGFISNPAFLCSIVIFGSLEFLLLLAMLILGFEQVIANPWLWIVILVLLSSLVFFLFLIRMFSYRLIFDDNFVYQYKLGKLVSKCKMEDVRMVFISYKYGYVNIEGTTIEGKKIVMSFEYSKHRGKIIKRLYKKAIENLPEKYKL